MKRKLTNAQKRVQKTMTKNRQVDSQNLRSIIINKLKWADAERKKGYKQIQEINIQIERLNGIILFCNDLIAPIEKKDK